MRRFVRAVEKLQSEFGVTIHCDDNCLVLRDDIRTGEWITPEGVIYGQWDAFFFGTCENYPFISSSDLSFEDFDAWDK